MNTVTPIFKILKTALTGGVSFNILTKGPLSCRKRVHFCINLFFQSFSRVMKWFCLRK